MENKRQNSSFSLFVRIAAVLTAVLISFALLPAAAPRASAQTNTTIYYDDFGYIIDVDKDTGKFVAMISEFRPKDTTKDSYDITVPDTIDVVKYPVTGIYSNAFNNYLYKNKIKSVKLPNSVTKIGDYAFLDCKALEKVDFGSDLLTIGRYAFSGCSALKEAKLPSKLIEIADSAFNNCTSLKTVDLPKTLEYIGQFAFAGCIALEAVEIPESIKGIGSSAFDNCSALKKLVLPKTLTAIDNNTFHNCTSLPEVIIPESLKTIGASAFAGCSSLTSVSFPSTLETVGAMAFSGCKNLTAVIIPVELENISDSAFTNSPVEIWGYSGSYADSYAYRNGIRQFHSVGSVQKVTFSADNLYVTVNNIAIRSSKGNLVIPPAKVTNGELLTINITAPTDYLVDYITINGSPFANGSTFTVGNTDIAIFASYKHKEAITTTSPAITTVTTTTTQKVTTVTEQSTNTTSVLPSPAADDDDDSTEIIDDGSSTGSYVKIKSDLKDTGGTKVRIRTYRNNFIAPATVRVTNTDEAEAAAKSAAEAIDAEKLVYYAFDISLYDENGKQNQGLLAKGSINFQIPVPSSLLSYADKIKVYHIVDETPVLINSTVVEDINGVKKVDFDADSFSPYMLVASSDDDTVSVIDEDTTKPANNTGDDDGEDSVGVIEEDDDDNSGSSNNSSPDAHIVDDKTTPTRPSYNGNINPHTGVIIAGTAVCGISLICIPLVRSRKKRKRTKSPIE